MKKKTVEVRNDPNFGIEDQNNPYRHIKEATVFNLVIAHVIKGSTVLLEPIDPDNIFLCVKL